jgi:Zn ribbon nucleic-acid-binding protein
MSPKIEGVTIRKINSKVCPHCKTGADGKALGLFWEDYDRDWRCIICGYRNYRSLERI